MNDLDSGEEDDVTERAAMRLYDLMGGRRVNWFHEAIDVRAQYRKAAAILVAERDDHYTCEDCGVWCDGPDALAIHVAGCVVAVDLVAEAADDVAACFRNLLDDLDGDGCSLTWRIHGRAALAKYEAAKHSGSSGDPAMRRVGRAMGESSAELGERLRRFIGSGWLCQECGQPLDSAAFHVTPSTDCTAAAREPAILDSISSGAAWPGERTRHRYAEPKVWPVSKPDPCPFPRLRLFRWLP